MGVDSWVSSPLFNNMIIALSINIIIVYFLLYTPKICAVRTRRRSVVLSSVVQTPVAPLSWPLSIQQPRLSGKAVASRTTKLGWSCKTREMVLPPFHSRSAYPISYYFYMALLGFGI